MFWLTKKTAYNDFSAEFSQTRKSPLPEFSLFEEELKNAKKILYIGCGNGRNIPLLQKNGVEVVGLDASEGLLKEAKKNKELQDVAFVHGFAENLPFENEEFDAIVAFASLHHITNTKKRETAFSEAFRVLKKNGVFLGTVWNLYQERFTKHEKEAKKRARFFPWWKKNDFLIPWGQKKLPRLYYRFSLEELQKLLEKNGFEEIDIFSQNKEKEKTHPYGGMNICFIGKKNSDSVPLFSKEGLGEISENRLNPFPTLPLRKGESKKRIHILGVPFDPVTKKEVLQKMKEYAAGKKQMFATTPNPEICMAAQKDKEFLNILQSADLSFADGIGILWASNLSDAPPDKESIPSEAALREKLEGVVKKNNLPHLTSPARGGTHRLFLSLLKFSSHRKSKYLPEQVCGSDVFREFCAQSKEPIFLLGGAPGAAKKCQEIFNNLPQSTGRDGNLPVPNDSDSAGSRPQKRHDESIPLQKEKDLLTCPAKPLRSGIVDTDDGSSKPDDEERILKKINDSEAKVLFVAFGAPTQEKWITRNLKKMPNIRLAMGIGGSFDFVAGAQKRAPKLIQKLGIEWAWRLLLEPKKRGKRILTAVWSFPREVWKS